MASAEPEGSYDNPQIKSMFQHYGPAVKFEKQDRKNASQLIYSSSVSTADIITQVSKLKSSMQDASVVSDLLKHGKRGSAEDSGNTGCPLETKASILHRAVGILRDEIAALEMPSYYPTTDKIGLEASAGFIPPLLSQTMLWLIDEKAYEAADADYTPSEETKRRSHEVHCLGRMCYLRC